jgi:CubicO group peptidase (beta-lactamase class C family)
VKPLLCFSICLLTVSCPVRAQDFDAAEAYSLKTGGQAFLVRVNGKIIRETYSEGGGRDIPQKIYSGTKAFWSLTALVAAEQGILKLDEAVAETLPEWSRQTNKSKIVVRDLLNFTSGLSPMPELHENDHPDRTTAALNARILAQPGDRFFYGPASLQVFHEVLARKLKKKTPIRFLEREVLSPLGLPPQRYLPDGKSVPLLAAGWMQTARQWSAIGRVILEKGGPVLDEEEGFVEEILKGGKANEAYAFGFWNNRAAQSKSSREIDVETMMERKLVAQSWRNICLSKIAPAELIACIGSYGQRLYVLPSRRLVIVRLGKGETFKDAPFLKALFQKPSRSS